MKSIEAILQDEWFDSPEGQRLCAGEASGVYLRNRLEVAFQAGMKAQSVKQNREYEHCRSVFSKVAKFLLDSDTPMLANEIVTGTKITRSALSQVLHRTHRHAFVSSLATGYSRTKRWGLSDLGKKQALEQLVVKR